MSVQEQQQVPVSISDDVVNILGLLSNAQGSLSTISNWYNALVQTKLAREKEIETLKKEIEALKVTKETFEKTSN